MNICVVGLQWGDEGKGKVVDILAQSSDIVVRYAGGANAGHTVVIGDEKFALHLMPSGAVRPETICVVGNGVVVDPAVLIEEIDHLESRGLSLDKRLFVSENAHVVLDYHKLEDQLREDALGDKKIGTTIRGIGPCYADKVHRSNAIRMADFRDLNALRDKIARIVEYKNKIFAALYDSPPTNPETIFEVCRKHAQKLLPHIINTTRYLHQAIDAKKNILFEGAQGALLDLDHGTFPYVTSSNASALGMPAGSGVPAQMVDRIIGVVKAYSTRVGSGPFPTEQDNEIGQTIRDRGNEYGTTTGRPRRCGWFDAIATKYTARLGGITDIAMMHLDTLSGLEEVNVCKAYEIDGKETDFFPCDASELSRVKPVFEALPGWGEDLSEIKTYAELPDNTRNYIKRVEEIAQRKISILGVGPKRSQTIFRE